MLEGGGQEDGPDRDDLQMPGEGKEDTKEKRTESSKGVPMLTKREVEDFAAPTTLQMADFQRFALNPPIESRGAAGE